MAYGGGGNGLIYVYNGNSIKQTLDFHGEDSGFVGAINWVGGKLFSGSRDGKVLITDTSSMTCIKGFQADALPRAIDSHLGKIVVGLRNGNIEEYDIESGEQKVLSSSHNDGEVWGLDSDGTYVYTTGDDN